MKNCINKDDFYIDAVVSEINKILKSMVTSYWKRLILLNYNIIKS